MPGPDEPSGEPRARIEGTRHGTPVCAPSRLQGRAEQGRERLDAAATPAEVERWHGLMDQARAVLGEKQVYSQETMGEIQKHLEDYRDRPRLGDGG